MQAINQVIKVWSAYFLRLAAYYFLLVACPIFGQALQKKTLTESDYKLWGFLVNQGLSARGNWASYAMRYDSADTLFVKNTATGKTFVYPKSFEGEFGGESWFACKRNDTLALQNLETGQLTYIPKISRFTFSGDGNYLLLFYSEADGGENLIVKDRAGQIVASASGVSEWKWNEAKNTLAYCTSTATLRSVETLSMNGKVVKKSIISASTGAYKNLAWQKHYLAFMQENDGRGALFLYYNDTGKLDSFMPESTADFPRDMTISSAYDAIKIAADGSRVTFNLKEPEMPKTINDVVQVWNGNDKQLYPSVKKYGDNTLRDKSAVWFPKDNKFIQLSNRKDYVAILGAKGSHAITYDPMAYEPHSDAYGLCDVYVTNLETGKKQTVFKQFSGHSGALQLSPDGKYISYLKEKNWWVYNIISGKHCNVTADFGVPFYNIDFDYAGEVPMYGIAGWSPDDKSMFIYDQYDIWKISPDGTKRQQLTHGRSDKITFRIDNFAPDQNALDDGITIINTIVDKTRKLLLKAQNKEMGYSGYFTLDSKNGLRQLTWSREKTDRIIKATTGDSFTYAAESFDKPATLMYCGNGAISEVYQSNRHHYNYKWGHTERITYNANGKELSGIVVLPAQYEPIKQYPMIVSIYERQSSFRHDYVNPSLYNEGGINPTNLSAKGYFVLFPDIAYTMRDMGDSAVKCVLAATDAALSKYNIDPKRVGLTGHSFGGYETDFIITKTNRFAAALSGSGISDLVSQYLHVGENSKPNFFRFEHQQQRMERSLFEDRESYFRNSPILQAEGVQTPLLAWTGDADDNVHPFQSIEFYLALRRLGKEQVLLVYPGQGHSLDDKEKQANLTHRFEAWFEKYLRP